MFKNIYYFFCRTKTRIEMKIDKFRGKCQRFKRGWSYGDVWNMCDWFMRTIKPMLIHLRDKGLGVPLEFEDNEDDWYTVLTEMIDCLDLMNEDKAYEHIGFPRPLDYSRITKNDIIHVGEVMDSNKDRFFELFSKYFYNLWD